RGVSRRRGARRPAAAHRPVRLRVHRLREDGVRGLPRRAAAEARARRADRVRQPAVEGARRGRRPRCPDGCAARLQQTHRDRSAAADDDPAGGRRDRRFGGRVETKRAGWRAGPAQDLDLAYFAPVLEATAAVFTMPLTGIVTTGLTLSLVWIITVPSRAPAFAARSTCTVTSNSPLFAVGLNA